MSQPVAFIGLGSMGTPMAMNLLKGGVSLFVYNRTPEKASALVKQGAKQLAAASEAFQKANIVITMLANDKALEDVTIGQNGLLDSMKPGCIHISMSTVAPDTNRKLEKLHSAKGAHFIAAPVFGRPDVAAQAKLWICVSGIQDAKKQVEPILQLLGQRIEDFGEEVGSANVVKLAGNFLILSAIEAMGEAFNLGEKNGISREQMASFYSETFMASPVYRTYGKIIATKAFEPAGFKLVLGLKDISLAKNTAEASKVGMPLANLLQTHMLESISEGRGDMDWSAISLAAKYIPNQGTC
jgi:3-hydroxyisobutyrate dehydrogenase-like beta-hydroxyacid dehydrogenase